MPKTIRKDLAKVNKLLHPKSRKTAKLSQKCHRIANRQKSKHVQKMKENIIGEKLLWFQNHLKPDVSVYSPAMVIEIIEKYLGRFDDELEQIEIKNNIGQRKNRRHANREDIVKLTKLHEHEEFATCGIEIPDLLNPAQFKLLKEWNGELRFLQKFRLKRFTQNLLRNKSNPSGNNTDVCNVKEVEEDENIEASSTDDSKKQEMEVDGI